MSAAAPSPQPNSPDKIAHDWAVLATRAPRVAATLGRYDVVPLPTVPQDPLKFRDQKPYPARLKAARLAKL